MPETRFNQTALQNNIRPKTATTQTITVQDKLDKRRWTYVNTPTEAAVKAALQGTGKSYSRHLHDLQIAWLEEQQ